MSLLGAAAITAGANLVGGLIGAHSSRKSAKESNAEAKRQFDINTNESIQRRVQDALKAGINPLAALGANVGSGPTIHAGGGDDSGAIMANAISGAGSAIGRALMDKQADDMEFDTQAKELDLESARLRNRIMRQQLLNMTNPSQDTEPSMQGESLLFQPVYDIQGRPRLVVNQNALEADSDNPGYMSSIIATLADGIRKGQIDPVSGEVKSNQLRMMIDDYYYNTTGHHINNLESLYISPTEAAMAATMLARGVS